MGRGGAPGRRRRTGRRALLGLLVLPLLVLGFAGLVLFFYVFQQVPLPDEIGTEATLIVDSAGQELGSLELGREEVPLGSLPDHVVQAVLAAEDASFYEHRGVSVVGIFRAAITNVLRGSITQGGSTISQQYVKTVTQDRERTALRKVREAALAVKLEQQYSKDEILEFYLNTIYFGRGAYGIQSAAQAYYGKDAAALDLAEAAQLAGIIPAPSRLDPLENPDGADRRYRYVLDRLVASGWLSSGEAGRLALERPLPVERRGISYDNAPFFLDLVRRELARVLGTQEIERGLRVTTTLNLGVQRAAERAYAEAFNGIEPTGAIVAVDPGSGGVRALVGGKDYASDQLNMALAARQPGSTFKPLVLAAWIEQGRSPESYLDGPAQLDLSDGHQGWTVRNYGGAGFGRTSVREATWRSVNTVYAQMGAEVGLDAVVDLSHRAGIPEERRLQPYLSLVLGSIEVSPLELAGAYNTFANGGVHREAFTVLEVERGGRVIYEARGGDRRAVNEQVAHHVTDVLRGVITNGTGQGAGIGRPAAGKTGTTQDYGDAWFAGYTPHLTAVVWMGNRDDRARMDGDPTGGGLPAQAWAAFMSDALTGVDPVEFPRPTGELRVVNPPSEPEPAELVCPEGEERVEVVGDDGEVTEACAAPEPEPTEEPTEPELEPLPEPTAPAPGPELPPGPSPSPSPTATAEPTAEPTHEPEPEDPEPEPSPSP